MIEVRELAESELESVDALLPLHRLGGTGVYLIAWEDAEPVGHVHIAWEKTELGVPELQDMFVLPGRRSLGVGTALAEAAERIVADRGHDRSSLSVGAANERARRLYERLGYVRAGVPPKRVSGTITIRGRSVEVDDTLLYFEKPVDFSPRRSS